jgi:hypothetical protein
LVFEAGQNLLKVRYELTAVKPLSIREIGLAMRLPGSAAQLAWNRAALWNAAPAGWLDGPREKATPEELAATLRSCKRILGDTPVGAPKCCFREASPECPRILLQLLSRRNLYRLAFEAAGGPLPIAPAGETMSLRFAASPREIALGDFLASQGFLGKYDLATIDREAAAGQTLTGGVTLNLPQPRTWTTLP